MLRCQLTKDLIFEHPQLFDRSRENLNEGQIALDKFEPPNREQTKNPQKGCTHAKCSLEIGSKVVVVVPAYLTFIEERFPAKLSTLLKLWKKTWGHSYVYLMYF